MVLFRGRVVAPPPRTIANWRIRSHLRFARRTQMSVDEEDLRWVQYTITLPLPMGIGVDEANRVTEVAEGES